MIIYEDLLGGDEIISDAHKIVDASDSGGCLWEVDGAMVKQGAENIVLAGANPSAEGEDADDGGEDGGDSQPKLNFAIQHSYQFMEAKPDWKIYSAELKKYLKKVMTKMQEVGKSPEDIDEFKKGAPAALKKIQANWKDYDIYLPERAEPDGQGNNMTILVNFRDDGLTPFIIIWKHGLKETKV